MTHDAHLKEWLEELDCALLPLDDAPVECDGMTYAISALLAMAGISHRAFCGFVRDTYSQVVVTPHCWVELAGGEILDLRLRMWLGDADDIPHGVLTQTDQERFDYQGQRIEGAPLSWSILSVMTDGRIEKVRLPCPPSQEVRYGT